MELVTLAEFQKLTLLNSEDILSLLGRGEIRCSVGKSGEVLVDLDSVTEAGIAMRGKSDPFALSGEDAEYMEEIIATEVIAVVDDLLAESLSLALKWQSETRRDEESS